MRDQQFNLLPRLASAVAVEKSVLSGIPGSRVKTSSARTSLASSERATLHLATTQRSTASCMEEGRCGGCEGCGGNTQRRTVSCMGQMLRGESEDGVEVEKGKRTKSLMSCHACFSPRYR